MLMIHRGNNYVKIDNYVKTENVRTVLRRTAQCPSLDG